MRTGIYMMLLFVLICGSAWAVDIPAKTFDTPERTTWKPEGCRVVPAQSRVLPSAVGFRNLHSDEVNTDEVSVALTPVFQEGWTAEPDTWNGTGPVFDNQGNLYYSPSIPHENVVMISLNPDDGSRRFAIPNTTGAIVGAGSPMILTEPGKNKHHKGHGNKDKDAKEVVYLTLYDRAFAVNTDGSVIWDKPTGLSNEVPLFSFGANYAPTVDAIVGLMSDGAIYALDRRTGESVLNAPFQLPGEASPPGESMGLPASVVQCIAADLAQFMDMSEISFTKIVNTLQGNGVEVANFFSIDANTGHLWIAATAPDDEDGTVDGVSSYGALYKLAFVPSGDKYDLVELCHASFEGGSASTPALLKDGTRAYVGDNTGLLIAIDTSDCSRIWELKVDSKITGSIGVASDNNEIYVSTRPCIIKVIDEGDHGTIVWRSEVDAFEAPQGMICGNQNLVTIGANGLAIQLGVGYPPGYPVNQGIGLLDRETGKLRWFTEGGEQTVAEMSTGPDGALYIGNSGLRKVITNCLAQAGMVPFAGAPQRGGITKYEPARLDILARDAICAAADRAMNALDVCHVCRDSSEADVKQILELINQAKDAMAQAEADGDLSMPLTGMVGMKLCLAEKTLTIFGVKGLSNAMRLLEDGCLLFDEQ